MLRTKKLPFPKPKRIREFLEALKAAAANRRGALVARKLGVSQSTISRWLSGQREPRLKLIQSLDLKQIA